MTSVRGVLTAGILVLGSAILLLHVPWGSCRPAQSPPSRPQPQGVPIEQASPLRAPAICDVAPTGIVVGRTVTIAGRLIGREPWQVFDVYVDGLATRTGDGKFRIERVYRTAGLKAADVVIFEEGTLEHPVATTRIEFEVLLDDRREREVGATSRRLSTAKPDWATWSEALGRHDPTYVGHYLRLYAGASEFHRTAILYALAHAPSVEAFSLAVDSLTSLTGDQAELSYRMLSALLGPRALRDVLYRSQGVEDIQRRLRTWMTASRREAIRARLDGHREAAPWWERP